MAQRWVYQVECSYKTTDGYDRTLKIMTSAENVHEALDRAAAHVKKSAVAYKGMVLKDVMVEAVTRLGELI